MRAILLGATSVLLAVVPHTGAQLLVGYGNSPYNPLCSESCLRSFSSLSLDCEALADAATLPVNHDDQSSNQTDHDDQVISHRRRHDMAMTTPECFANNTPFLTSVAWCINTRCQEQGNVLDSLIEQHWDYWLTGTKGVVKPKWSYAEALARVNPAPPRVQLEQADTMLNETSLAPPATYLAQWNVLGAVNHEMERESTYGIVIAVVVVGLPVLLRCLAYIPLIGKISDKVKPYLIWPSTVGTLQLQPLPYLLGNVPTRGQALYILLIFILNFVLAGISYSVRQPSAWFSNDWWRELNAYILYRTGSFAFTLLPLLILFSSRNNILLWITDFSHATFLVLHRWLARFFMLHTLVHSILGAKVYASYVGSDWWNWGILATVLTVFLTMFGSTLYIRKNHYEFFLVMHVLLALLIVLGCWYHIVGWYASMSMSYPDTSGYEVWLYIVFAVWGFDRVLRVGRVLRNGIKQSVVTELGTNGEYVRVDIPGLQWGWEPGRHAYAFFPTISPWGEFRNLRLWRSWENHPFSCIPTAMLEASRDGSQSSSPHRNNEKPANVEGGYAADEKAPISGTLTQALDVSPQASSSSPASGESSQRKSASSTAGVTLFIKKSEGMTKYFRRTAALTTLLDGPYANSPHSVNGIMRCDRVLLIGGGIGITALIPWMHQGHRSVRLCWSVRESARCLVDAVGMGIGEGVGNGLGERDVRIGERFDVRRVLAEEADAGWKRIGVVVSGPGSLCDDVRAGVAELARSHLGTVAFELEVEAYSW